MREFAEKEITPTALKRDKECDIKGTLEILKKLFSLGYGGIRVPREYGGAGEDLYSWIIMLEELGYADLSVAMPMLVHSGSACDIILDSGSESIKQKHLPLICKGEELLGIAITESDIPGSWASYVSTTASSRGGKYNLKGKKMFITNAGLANLFVVFARSSALEKGHEGVGIFLVERDSPGFSFEGEVPSIAATASSWGIISFDNCEVPDENMLMPPPDAFSRGMRMFNTERVGNPSICNGMAQRALDEAVRFLRDRKEPKAGKSFLDSYQDLQFKVAEMDASIRACRMLVWYAAFLLQNGLPPTKEVAEAKFLSNQTVRQVCTESAQLQGAYGLTKGLFAEKLVRDSMYGGIAGGTIEILKSRAASEIVKQMRIK